MEIGDVEKLFDTKLTDVERLFEAKLEVVKAEIKHLNDKFATMKWFFGVLIPAATTVLVVIIQEVMK